MMLAPKSEEELEKFLICLKRQVLIETTKESIKELSEQTGIGMSEISSLIGIEIDEIKVRDIPKIIKELKVLLPSWGREIEKRLEIWL